MKDIQFNIVPKWCPYTPQQIRRGFEFDLHTATGKVEYCCVHCRVPKHENINTIRLRIRNGTFTSLCSRCRGLIQRQKEEVLIVKTIPEWLKKYFKNNSKLSVMELINVTLFHGQVLDIQIGGITNRGLKTTCWKCTNKVHSSISRIKRSIDAGTYTGLCRKCLSTVRNNVSQDKPILNNGYVLIQKSLVPAEHQWLCNWDAPVFLHRYKMSVKMNRPLTKDEVVHHIDGNKQNNNIENLELWNKSHPSGQRVEDKLQWAKEFVAKYDRSTL